MSRIRLLSVGLLALLATFVLSGNTPAAAGEASDTVVRAAFDLGSSATKMVVARVDLKSRRVVDVLYPKSDTEGRVTLPFRDLIKAEMTDAEIDAVVMQVKEVVGPLKAAAEAFGAKEFGAVATTAFRKAGAAGERVATRITAELGIPIRVAPGADEGSVGFFAVCNMLPVDPQQVVVWDVGSTGVEFSMLASPSMTGEHKFVVYNGTWGSEAFRDDLIKAFQKPGKTPNPLSAEEIAAAQKIAADRMADMPNELREKLAKPETQVIGIGGVHYFSIRGQAMTKTDEAYTPKMVQAALARRAGQTDETIGGNFASTEVSNLALVSGMMSGAKIESVRPHNLNMAYGILTLDRYWRSTAQARK